MSVRKREESSQEADAQTSAASSVSQGERPPETLGSTEEMFGGGTYVWESDDKAVRVVFGDPPMCAMKIGRLLGNEASDFMLSMYMGLESIRSIKTAAMSEPYEPFLDSDADYMYLYGLFGTDRRFNAFMGFQAQKLNPEMTAELAAAAKRKASKQEIEDIVRNGSRLRAKK